MLAAATKKRPKGQKVLNVSTTKKVAWFRQKLNTTTSQKW
jgi:hypothetical protein